MGSNISIGKGYGPHWSFRCPWLAFLYCFIIYLSNFVRETLTCQLLTNKFALSFYDIFLLYHIIYSNKNMLYRKKDPIYYLAIAHISFDSPKTGNDNFSRDLSFFQIIIHVPSITEIANFSTKYFLY